MDDTELVQVVDERDNPLKGATKQELRGQGLCYRVSRVMVEDENGNVLLQRRFDKSTLYPGRWDNSAAGHVEAGETYEATAARELDEEMGIRDVSLTQIDHYFSQNRFRDMQLNEWHTVYKAVVDHSIKVTPQPEEVAETRWFTRPELRQLVHNPEQVTHGLREAVERHYRT